MKNLILFKFIGFFIFLINNSFSFMSLGIASIKKKLELPNSFKELDNVFESDSVAIGSLSGEKKCEKKFKGFFKLVRENYSKYENSLTNNNFLEKRPEKFEEITKIIFSGLFFDREKKIIFDSSLKREDLRRFIKIEETESNKNKNIIIENSLILDEEKEENFRKNLKELKSNLEKNLNRRPNLKCLYFEILKMDKENFDENQKETEEKLRNFLNTFCHLKDGKIKIDEDLSEERLLELILEYTSKYEKEFEDFKKNLQESFQETIKISENLIKLVNKNNYGCARCNLLANHEYMNENKNFFEKKEEFFIDLNKNFEFEKEKPIQKYIHFGFNETNQNQYDEYLEKKRYLNYFEKNLKMIYPNLFEEKKIDKEADDFDLDIIDVPINAEKNDKKPEKINLKNDQKDSEIDRDSIKKLKEQTEKILDEKNLKNYSYLYNLLALDKLNIENENECKKLLNFADILYFKDTDGKVKIREDLSIESLINSELESLKYLLEKHEEYKKYYREDNNKPSNLGACKCNQGNAIVEQLKKGLVRNIKDFAKESIKWLLGL